ncbi:MAG: metallopeptidase family protein [Bacillota bacterium]
MNFEEFTEYADYILIKEVPEPLFRDLNLGVIVLPETKRDEDRYVLGHYSVSRIGRHIALFYGSFRAVLGNARRSVWEEHIRRTIKHELRHHAEALAGDEALAKDERREKARREAAKRRGQKRTKSPTSRLVEAFLRLFRGR